VRKREQLVQELFDTLDVNHDGKLSPDEIEAAANNTLNIRLSKSEIKKLFESIHPNNTTEITWKEFEKVLVLFPAHSKKELIQMWGRTATLSYYLHHDKPAQQPSSITLIAGFVAGAISRTMTAPFDRVSIVLRAGQTIHEGKGVFGALRSMIRAGGILSLWQGNGVNCIQVGPESALTFFLYEFFKSHGLNDPQHPNPMEKFFFGALAGWSAMTLVYPMYVIQTRMAIAEPVDYKNLFDCFRQTYRAGGWTSLFRGYYPSTFRIVPYKGGDLLIFNTLKEMFVKEGENISVVQSMIFGAFASCFSQTLTYPLVTARTKLIGQSMNGRPTVYRGMWDALKKTVMGNKEQGLMREGFKGLYHGCIANLCKMVPAVSIQFAVYEQTVKILKGSNLF